MAKKYIFTENVDLLNSVSGLNLIPTVAHLNGLFPLTDDIVIIDLHFGYIKSVLAGYKIGCDFFLRPNSGKFKIIFLSWISENYIKEKFQTEYTFVQNERVRYHQLPAKISI